MHLFAGLVFLAWEVPMTVGLVCLACDQVSSIRDCSNIQTCGPHEICYVDQHVSVRGIVTYQGGCRDRRRCPSVLGGKRDNIVRCSQCCDQPWCQASLCGGTGYPADRGIMCYDCPHGYEHADDCDKIIEASRDQACAESMMITNQGTIKYVTSLIGKTECDRALASLGQAVGKRQITRKSGPCYYCCSNDLCNDNCVSSNHTVQVCQDTGTRETCTVAASFVCADRTLATNAGCLHSCGLC